MFLVIFLSFYLAMTIEEYFIIKLAIIVVYSIRMIKNKNKYVKYYVFTFLMGLLINVILKQNYFFSNIGIVVNSKSNYFILQTLSGRYYCKMDNHTLEVFDLIQVEGEIKDYSFTTYESQFDFSKYLKNCYVYKEISLNQIRVIQSSLIRPKSFLNNYLNTLDENSKTVVSYLLFNHSFNKEYVSLVSNNNLFYYLSISSFHLYFLFNQMEKLLQIKISEQRSRLITLIFNLLAIFISQYRLSIIRLFIFNIIKYFNRYHYQNKIERFDVIGMTFLLMGVLFPQSLKGSSFYYSFPLQMLLYYSYDAFKCVKKRQRGIYYLVLINLYFIIVSLFTSGKYSLFSLLYGVILSPIIYLAFILSLIKIIIPLPIILEFVSLMIISSVKIFDAINLVIYSDDYNLFFFLFSLGFLLLGLYLVYTGRKERVYLPLYGVILSLLIPCLPIVNLYQTSVYFINVGQGDSILIKNRNQNILIDTGGSYYNDLAKETLIPFFKKNHILQIDYLIITHNDFDHAGAKQSLENNYKVINTYDNSNFNDIFLKDLSLINLNTYVSLWDDKNNSSLVLYLKFKDESFLLTGDAGREIEKQIIKDYPSLEIDYLKVGHHGSNTSTCEELLNQYNFKEAIISVGRNNYYDHPSEEVITLLNKKGIKIRRTDIEGTIKYSL